jgi:hypothetical protein
MDERQAQLAAATREAAALLVVGYRKASRALRRYRQEMGGNAEASAFVLAPEIEDEISLREEELFVLPQGEELRKHVRALDSAWDGMLASQQVADQEFERARRQAVEAAMNFEAQVRSLAEAVGRAPRTSAP